MWDKVGNVVLTLVCVAALGAVPACAASDGEEPFPSSEDEIQASVGERLAGTYADGAGALTDLKLDRVRSGNRYSYTFTASQRVMCVRAPCPAHAIQGKWFANSTVLALSLSGGDRIEYRYKLTGAKLSLRDRQGNELASLTKLPALGSAIGRAMSDFGIAKAHVDIAESEIAKQEALGGTVKFEPAFRAALKSFLTDGDGGESPLSLINDLDADDLPEGCGRLTSKEARLKCLVNDGETEIRMLKVGQTAEEGESVKDNWIFTISLPQLSDHGHWAIVDRKGRAATYNYGFN